MDKCNKVVEHLINIMYATNFGQPQSREGVWHKIIVNNEDIQNIHMLLKVVCCFIYVREL